MLQKLRVALLALLAGAIVISYQNCADYVPPEYDLTRTPRFPIDADLDGQELNAPGIEVTGYPGLFTGSNGAEVSFNVSSFNDGEVTRVDCSFNETPFAECESPFRATGLAEGEHSLVIQVTNTNRQESRLEVKWNVDLTPSEITILSGPAATTTETVAVFTFRADEEPGGSGLDLFQCRIDGGPLLNCLSPVTYADLTVGIHTFELVVTDVAGNVQSEVYEWEIVQ